MLMYFIDYTVRIRVLVHIPSMVHIKGIISKFIINNIHVNTTRLYKYNKYNPNIVHIARSRIFLFCIGKTTT